MRAGLLLVIAASIAGCDADVGGSNRSDGGPGRDDGGGSSTDDGGDTTDGGGSNVTPVTYREHVAPLLQARCVSCHQAGGIGPFVLDSYAAASSRALSIKSSTAARSMPPWGPLDDGTCQSWRDSRYLAAGDLATFASWADQGAPEGDTSIPIPNPPAPTTLTGANAVGNMPAGGYTVPSTGDEYRCFVLTTAATGTLPAPDANNQYLIAGFDVTPGNEQIVHHVIVWATTDAPANADPVLAARDAADAGPGWACPGGASINTPHQVVALWAPGTGATNYPAPTGIAVRADTRLVMQVHYSTSVANTNDPGTSIALEVVANTNAMKAAGWFSVANYGISIPPGQAAHTLTLENTLAAFASLPANTPGVLYGVYPHMHQIGTQIRLARNTNQCVVNVPQWDFHWQSAYFLQNPLAISTSDLFRLTCVYNSTGRATTTTYGEGSADEMCMVFLYAAPP